MFLLTRIKEAARRRRANEEAVALGPRTHGPDRDRGGAAVLVALGAFATSEIVFIKLVGVGAVLAVLIDATIVRALLVPALMALLGTRNWWAPKPLRTLHDQIGLSEGDPEELEPVKV